MPGRCAHGWTWLQGCRTCRASLDWREDYEQRTAGRMGSRAYRAAAADTLLDDMRRAIAPDAPDLGPTEGLARLGKDES
jgi:hypothetical protein